MRSRSVTVLAVVSAALVSGGWLMHRGFDSRGDAVDGARLFDDVKQLLDDAKEEVLLCSAAEQTVLLV